MKKYLGTYNFADNSNCIDLASKIKNEFEYTFQNFILSSIEGRISCMFNYQKECITILRLMRDVGIINDYEFNDAFECVNDMYDFA